jgi:hypothetical protein
MFAWSRDLLLCLLVQLQGSESQNTSFSKEVKVKENIILAENIRTIGESPQKYAPPVVG